MADLCRRCGRTRAECNKRLLLFLVLWLACGISGSLLLVLLTGGFGG